MNHRSTASLLCALAIAAATAAAAGEASPQTQSPWADDLLKVPYPQTISVPSREIMLQLLRQDYEQLEINQSVIKTPLIIGEKRFQRGLGTHSVGRIRLRSPQPLARFSAWIGVDHNVRTKGGLGSVVFAVSADGRERHRSGILRGGQQPQRLDLELGGATALDLYVDDAGDGPICDHADWAEAQIVTQDGKTVWLDQIRQGPELPLSRYPFSFLYGGRHSDELLPGWTLEQRSERIDADRNRTVNTWTDPKTGLCVEWQVTRFADFPAVEWVLYLQNRGAGDTPILEDVQSLNLALNGPLGESVLYRLHRTNGGPANPTDFEPRVVEMGKNAWEMLSGGGGRSSNRDFPFFKVETEEGSFLVAVGWSGQWLARLTCRENRGLHLTAGLERTRFLLHKGERVRSPRMLVLHWAGNTLESNAQFRCLVYKHYAATRAERKPLPTLFCNTCFTRGGGWLNECNAPNQISLIRAYAPLGLEALLTDAGWFEGGWPAGAGNWTPRKDAYPQGMAPVAAAAKEHGMVYGLWFEFERVVAGTGLHKQHPEWLLSAGKGPQGTYLLNLGLPEVRRHLLGIVKGFMDLPGFRFYRQDFNMDPLPYWRHSDAPDRQGITEMKYIEGLYAYWDEIARAWPDSFREECASGGRRIDLETVMRMQIHQKTDYWFDNEVDQGSIWGLSQYLPNNVFTAPINRLDDRSFHSVLATSLCLGWIADAPDFDAARAKQLVETYRQVRHLLIGAWYPLLPYSRDGQHWMASQYHRPDLQEGLVLVIPPKKSDERTVKLKLHGLQPQATYELHYQVAARKVRATGEDLMKQLVVTMPEGNGGERIVYRKLSE